MIFLRCGKHENKHFPKKEKRNSEKGREGIGGTKKIREKHVKYKDMEKTGKQNRDKC